MEDILELIKSRRNTKEFLPKFVDWDKISKIVDAGRHAPSCGNLQNWKFIVVINNDKKQELADAALQQYDLINAGALIVICAEPEKAERYYGLRGERLYTVQNCAAAAQNMLLEAHSLGLSSRWIGAFEEEMVKRILKVPEDARPQIIIAIGYPKFVPEKPPKLPLESVVFFNSWRNRIRDPVKYMQYYSVITQRKLSAAKEMLKKPLSVVVEKLKRNKE
ncbi:MAG: nitroreductase family protein [Candidatus Woesearchaeota archaeon]